MRNFFLIVFVAAFLGNCQNNKKSDTPELDSESTDLENFVDLNWLLGEWVNENDGMISKEIWTKKNADTYTGFSFRLLRNDTVFAEKMVIKQINEDLVLTVTTFEKNQEDDPVSFKLISSENKQFTFENKRQDFPKRITYASKGNNSLHAWIEGDVLGENKKIDFKFSRKK